MNSLGDLLSTFAENMPSTPHLGPRMERNRIGLRDPIPKRLRAAILARDDYRCGWSHNQRLASDIADAIIDSGQWVPRSALTAMSARIDAALKLHHVDTYCGGRRCVCEEDWPCATVRALAGGTA